MKAHLKMQHACFNHPYKLHNQSGNITSHVFN